MNRHDAMKKERRLERPASRERAADTRARSKDTAGAEAATRPSTIHDWSASLAASPETLADFDRAIGGLHARIASASGGPAVQLKSNGGAVGGDPQAIARSGLSGAGGTLPFRDRIQAAFGRHDVSQVRSFGDASAVRAGRQLGAHAFASGDSVAFARAPDLHTAAHEAAHVIQQRAGVSLSGGVGARGDAYERHADQVADAVVRGQSAEGLLARAPAGSGRGGVQRVAADGASSDSSATSRSSELMLADANAIVALLESNMLSVPEQRDIVQMIEARLSADRQVADVNQGRMVQLDRFLAHLKGREFRRQNAATLGQEQRGFVYDELWGRLEGAPLERFKAAVAQSSEATDGPRVALNPDAWSSVIKPSFWQITSLLSLGVVDEKLFDDMKKAALAGERPGGSAFFATVGVILERGFDALTLGTVRAAYAAQAALARQNPHATVAEFYSAGVLAAANCVLPIDELVVLAKALGMVEPKATEVPPDKWAIVNAVAQGFLKVVALHAFMKQHVSEPRKQAKEIDRLNEKTNQQVRESEAERGRGNDAAEPAAGGSGNTHAQPSGRSRGGSSDYHPSVERAAVQAGMMPSAVRAVQRVAARFGVRIIFRRTTRHARRHLERGALPKPADLKMKTINDLDLHLGASREHLGLVGYFEPRLPAQFPPGMKKAIKARHAQRMEEYHAHADTIERFRREGKYEVRDGIVLDISEGGAGKRITGDHDLYDIRMADGSPVPPELRAQVIAELEQSSVRVQHDDVKSWDARTSKDKKTKAGLIDDARKPGGEVVEFRPDGNAKFNFEKPKSGVGGLLMNNGVRKGKQAE